MKYTPTVWNKIICPHDIWFLLRFYLDYLYTIFLIFRANVKDDQSPESFQLFLSAAKDVLSTVLELNEHRDMMREVRSDFTAVVSDAPSATSLSPAPLVNLASQFLPFGLPCADVLAAELRHRPCSFSLADDSTLGPRPRLVRSDVIRDLTVFVSCLSWVAGQKGASSDFCKETQGRLSKILDQIIDTPLGSTANAAAADAWDPMLQRRECPDVFATSLNHLFFDWDISTYPDLQLDLFSESLT